MSQPKKIIRVKPGVVEKTGLCRASVYKLIKNDPSFPRPVKLGTRAVGFLENEIDDWIEKRAAAR